MVRHYASWCPSCAVLVPWRNVDDRRRHGNPVKLRIVYESARLGMYLRGFRSAAIPLGQGAIVDQITFLDGRHLCRHPPRDDTPLTVFLHGLGSSVATWSSVLPIIARTAPVVAPDLPGYGRTALPPLVRHATFRQKVDTVHTFLDAISPDTPVHLVGQSMGGWLAARVAAEHPKRVSRLTLVNAAGILSPQVFEQRKLFTPSDREELRVLWKSMWRRLPLTYYLLEDEYLRVTRTAIVRGFLDSVQEEDFLNGALGDIEAPTLLVWGLADRLISAESIETFRAGIRDIRVREIPHCGHIPQRECTRSFLAYVLPWLHGDEPPEPMAAGLRAARAPQ